jgi:glycosyltransferase involved in cell wall biosynthesis
MNILHFNPINNLAGASQSAMVLASGLSGHSVRSYSMVLEEGQLAEEYRQVFEDVALVYPSGIEHAGNKARRIMFATFRVVQAIRVWNIDLIHCHSATGIRYLYLAAKFCRKPIVCHIRDNYESNYFNRGLTASDRLIAISDWVYLGLPPKAQRKTVVIPNAVPTVASRKFFGDADDVVRVGFAGRWVREKGIDILIDAFTRMELAGRVEIEILGKLNGDPCDYTKEVLAQYQSLSDGLKSRVKIRAFSSQMVEFYKRQDIVVIPSRFEEPFGRVAIEAMACGCVVIAADHGGLSEIITDGVDGVLFAPCDSADLAVKLDQLLSDRDLFKQISINALATVQEYYLVERHAESVMNVYREVLGKC